MVYKKLLGVEVGIQDLGEIAPCVKSGLEALLDFEGDVEEEFCLSFNVQTEGAFGSKVSKNLIVNMRFFC